MSVDNWFFEETGLMESKWDFKLESLPDSIKKDMGTFTEIPLGALINRVSGPSNTLPVLNVYVRNTKAFEDYFDTSSLQYHGPNNAMYQVASNFNCLEVANRNVNPFSGSFLTNLMSDTTQGPSASGGAALGAIYRLITHNRNPINLLRDTNLKHNNGKLRQEDVNDDEVNNLQVNNIRIGLHLDTRALYKRTKSEFTRNPHGPIIDQVFTSTCISRNRTQCKLAEKMLKAAYEATYLAAAYRKSPQLTLTLIGGGCFKNNEEQIAKAIANAHNKFGKYLASGCIVNLPIYDIKPNSICDNLSRHTTINKVKY